MTVLLIDHDADMLDMLSFLFRREGHDVIAAHDGQVGLQLFEQKQPALVVLESALAGLSGWEVCKRIRQTASTPLIFLAASTDDADVVQGLDLGADDFISKPFSPRQLLARTRAILRRAQEAAAAPRKGEQAISAGDLRLDPQWRLVSRGDETIKLTAIEFKLLYELVVHEGQVLTHQRLTDRIWGYEAVDDANLLKGHVRNIRKKLERDPANPVYLQTITGVGYTFQPRAVAARTANAAWRPNVRIPVTNPFTCQGQPACPTA